MDDILDACFDENLFKTLLCHSKHTKETKIESRNPYVHVDKLESIYETHKVSKDEISALECHTTHEVAPRDTEVSENDLLYHYFAKLSSEDKAFMRTWLHLFIRLHRHFFTLLATKYFKCKGLTMDNWLDTVIEGCKGNVLMLLGLCMLVEKHVLVHLKFGAIWSSLKTVPSTHPDALKQVDLHLVYLGRGNFIKLQTHSTPLQVLSTMSSDSQHHVALSPEENKILDKLIMSGLGIGLDRETKSKGLHSKQPGKVVTSSDSKGLQCRQPVHSATSSDVVHPETDGILTVKQEMTKFTPVSTPSETLIESLLVSLKKSQTATTSTATPLPNIKVPVTEPSPTTTQIKYNPLVTTPVSLFLAKRNVKPGDRIKVTQEMLDCILTSRYSEHTEELFAVGITPETPVKVTRDEDDSDTTIIYWRNDNPIKTGKKQKGRKLKKPKMEKPK